MDNCNLDYIPDYLHTGERAIISSFSVGEALYRRVPTDKIEDAFGGISLVDLSVNRIGPPGEQLCKADDVLFNYQISDKQPNTSIIGESVICLIIRELNESNNYYKTKSFPEDNPTGFCIIKLQHVPVPCNYAHCAFIIEYNGVETTFENYKKGLKKNSALNNWCKLEIEKMIIHEEVRLNWPVEVDSK